MNDDVDSLVGRDASEMIRYLLRRHPEISKCFVFEPPFSRPLQENCTAGWELDMLDRALSLKSTTGLPFWEALMLLLPTVDAKAETLLRAAVRHNDPMDCRLEAIDADQLRANHCRLCDASSDSNRMLALQSRVLLRDGNSRHIPMLDFHVPASDRSLHIVMTVLRVLDLSGFVLLSGKSYHFYGDELMEERDLYRFLGKALLFTPIVDRAWIAHQLIASACALRVSQRPQYGGAPKVVARLEISTQSR